MPTNEGPQHVRLPIVALAAVILLAGGGWVAAQQIKSPAQVAADTAAPTASLVTAAVERRSLSTEVIVRGTGRYGKPQPISLPSSALKTSTQVISRIAKPDAGPARALVAMTVSGRPVFVLQGATPMHRDIGPGDSGEDVRQLERALARFGYSPGGVDGRYDGSTAAAVAQMYRAATTRRSGSPKRRPTGSTPRRRSSARRPTTCSRRASRCARHSAARRRPRSTRRSSTRGRGRADPAGALGDRRRAHADRRGDATSRRSRGALESEGDGAARRDVAAAEVDVTAKQNALNDAITRRSRPSAPSTPVSPTPRPPRSRRRARPCATRPPRSPAPALSSLLPRRRQRRPGNVAAPVQREGP